MNGNSSFSNSNSFSNGDSLCGGSVLGLPWCFRLRLPLALTKDRL